MTLDTNAKWPLPHPCLKVTFTNNKVTTEETNVISLSQ